MRGNCCDYFMSIKVPHFPKTEGIEYKFSHNLQKLVTQHMNSVSQCKSVVEFVRNIIQIVHTKLNMASNMTETGIQRDHIQFLKSVVGSMDDGMISENIVDDLDPTSGSVKLKYTDSTGYVHYAVITVFSKNSNKMMRLSDADLPEEVLSTFPQDASLLELYKVFKTAVDSLVPFWLLMNELSENTWVIEPDVIQKKHTHRRILINDNLSIVLTFNPQKTHLFPDIQFLGSLQVVANARAKYQNNLQALGWNNEISLLDNISVLCEIDNFPKKPESEETADDSKDCFICFSDMHPPPSKWCSNEKCSSYYHLSCLLEWLTTVPTSTVMLEFITGPCPYCNENIMCPYNESKISVV